MRMVYVHAHVIEVMLQSAGRQSCTTHVAPCRRGLLVHSVVYRKDCMQHRKSLYRIHIMTV